MTLAEIEKTCRSDDWDGAGAAAVTPAALAAAGRVLATLTTKGCTHFCAPSAGGGVVLGADWAEVYLEIEVTPAGRYELYACPRPSGSWLAAGLPVP